MTTRYISAEQMTHDDYGIPFTNKEGEIIYDARTLGPTGAWATMTQESWLLNGCGVLGQGYGQKYIRQANGQLHKVKG